MGWNPILWQQRLHRVRTGREKVGKKGEKSPQEETSIPQSCFTQRSVNSSGGKKGKKRRVKGSVQRGGRRERKEKRIGRQSSQFFD